MSGHSKWATIKHKKAVTDNKRGQIFTKLIRAITVAARDGGDLNSNFKLRLAVEKARVVNMPKANIERAVERGSGVGEGGSGLAEGVYEGFGPGNMAVMVSVLTDNKNRTASEIKKIFERGGGTLGQPGSVAFLFDKKGRLLIEKKAETESEILQLIDLGAEDVEEAEDGIEVLTQANKLAETKLKVDQAGFTVKEAELVFVPKNYLVLEEEMKGKAFQFLETLDNHDDVQEVYSNI
ncbi:MAG: YebC/PmpR family DNA-binding transcriptional regulator [Candidatus Beckwithbacteria bacterium]|nr:YebC/PmpR family DNA-binding transcriptional regulator [Candidatus Beckwithbacteria bacterium]